MATWRAEVVVAVQLLSRLRLIATPWTAAHQASPSFTISWSLLKVTSIESMIIQPSCPLSPLLLLPSVFASIRVFSSESALCIREPKYWSFSFSISPSREYSGFISFRIDWFDLLAVQGTLRSLLQHHSLKASILWCSAFFMVYRKAIDFCILSSYPVTLLINNSRVFCYWFFQIF